MNNFGQKSVSEILEFSKNGPKIKKILDDLFGAYENNESALARVQGKDPVNAQDFVTKAFLSANTQTLIQYAYATNTDITTNLNSSTGNFINNVPIFGNFISSGTDFTKINNEQVRTNFNGLVLCFSNIHLYSNSRTSVLTRFKYDSNPIGAIGNSFIYDSNNVQESSSICTALFSVENNKIIELGCRREANSGTTYMPDIDTSNVIILRLR